MKKLIFGVLMLSAPSVFATAAYPLNYYGTSGWPPNIPTAPQLTMDLNSYLAYSGNPLIPVFMLPDINMKGQDFRVTGRLTDLNRQTMPQDGYGIPDTTSPRMDDEEIR